MATKPQVIEIPSFEELYAAMQDHIDSTHFDAELPSIDAVDDPNPNPPDDPSSNYGKHVPFTSKRVQL